MLKPLSILFVLTLCMLSCRDQKEPTTEKPIPVEADGGIGDGAPALDSLIQQQQRELENQSIDTTEIPDSLNTN